MKKFKEWLRDWDEGTFDFTEEPKETDPADAASGSDSWRRAALTGLERREFRLFSRAFPAMAGILGIVMIIFLMSAVMRLPSFGSPDTPASSSETIRRYVEKGMEETGAVNIVAGVILDYRAFDTLGESHVLFTAAAAVFILMISAKRREESERDRAILRDDPILRNTTKVLIPIILLFGLYVIFNGHLGPGGGFSGGAIIGGGLILYEMSYGPTRLQRVLNLKTYRITVLVSLLFYSIAKCYSFYCGANGLETIFSPGTPGRIFSAGLILPLNMAVGIVVSCTLYGFYALFMREQI